MASTRLPPIPDEFLEPSRRAQVFGLVRGLVIPGRYKADLFNRWSKIVGEPASPAELLALRGKFRREEL